VRTLETTEAAAVS